MSTMGIARLCLLLISVVVVAGCQPSGPPVGYVEGTITLDGSPLPDASVTYSLAAGGTRDAMTQTDANGHYVMEFSPSQKGAPIGLCHVVVTKTAPSTKNPKDPEPDLVLITPKKYSLPGTLTADVKPGKNTFDFALDAK